MHSGADREPTRSSDRRRDKGSCAHHSNGAQHEIVKQVVNAIQSAVNPVCKFTQTKNPSSDVGEKEIDR